MNLSKIPPSKNVPSKIPSDMLKDDLPMVTYKVQKLLDSS